VTNYVHKFWQMIWEKRISLIVMLCPTINSSNHEECMNYWNLDSVG